MRTGMMATAMGLGGALVYLLDPERGGRRRALLRDKLQALRARLGDPATAADVRARASELADRARGALDAYPGARRLFDAGTSPAARPLAAAAGALLATVALRRTAAGRVLGATGATLLVNTLMSRQAYGRR